MTSRVPFQSLDKSFLALTQAPWSSFAPTWRLEYRGTLSEEQLLQALQWLLPRYPWCAAKVAGLEWVLPERIDARSQLTILDLRADSETVRAQKEQARADRFLQLEQEPPFALTWVRRTDETGVLMLQQHHSLADGRSFLAFIGDFIRCLDSSGLSPLPAAIVPRRPENEAIADRGLARVWAFIRGAMHTLGDLLMADLRPLMPLFSNTGTDYSGQHRTRHFFVPLARMDAWREGRKKLGLSANDLLAGALCVAVSRWSKRLGVEPGRHNLLMAIDVRPREGFESFANHLSWLQVRWRARTDARPITLAQELQLAAAGVLAKRLPWKRVLFDGWLTLKTPLKVLRRSLLERRQLLTNFSFSNLIPLGTPGAGADGRWRTKSLVIERLLITTPCVPPQGANTTVIRYGDDACFNFNFKDTAVTEKQIEALVEEFSQALDELEQDLAPGT